MKTLCVLALVAIALAQVQICLPPQHSFFLHHIDSLHEEADLRQEFNDFTNEMFARRIVIWADHRPADELDYHHIWIYPSNQTAYVFTFRHGPFQNETACSSYKIPPIRPRDPCFTTNGTHQRTYTIAGVKVDSFYHEENTQEESRHGIIGVTATGIPVEASYWIIRNGDRPNENGMETFHDVVASVPKDAFFLNAECSRLQARDLKQPTADVLKLLKL